MGQMVEILSQGRPISRIYMAQDIDGIEECLEGYGHIYAVMDNSVALHCPAALHLAGILNRMSVPGLLVNAAEETKNMESVMGICGWLLEQGADRDALVLAVGGGITSDMVGFAASIYKRGVRFAYVPTTLLSQVDAAIGGKTGVNFRKYKNMLGVIRQPEFTWVCPQMLEGLSRRDFLSGAAEMLKTFIIEDGGNYGKAVGLLSRISEADEDRWEDTLKQHREELLSLTAAAVRVKAGVVSRDQYEADERRKLNLGHTFAHAVETLAGKNDMDISHGEAVAMGILLAARLSDRLRKDDRDLYGTLRDDFLRCGLPVESPFPPVRMTEIMRKDKKAEDGIVHFVIPYAVGDVRMEDLDVEEVAALLA